MDLPPPPKGNICDKNHQNLSFIMVAYIVKIFSKYTLHSQFKVNFFTPIFTSTDTGLRNIIDKLAEFVARNGPEFESITKVKQQGNPKFSFLYGGENYLYYQWRVSTEQASKTFGPI